MFTHPVILWFINVDLDPASGYGHGTKMSPRHHSICFSESQRDVLDPTNPSGAFDDCVQYRLHVGRRAADDAEHFGRSRLMLQSLAQFGIALLDFLEEPYVFNGDDCLRGEGFKEFDLPI